MPHEISLFGVYFPPILINFALGLTMALGTAIVLNYFRLSRFLAYPPVVFISMVILYTCMLSSFVILA